MAAANKPRLSSTQDGCHDQVNKLGEDDRGADGLTENQHSGRMVAGGNLVLFN